MPIIASGSVDVASQATLLAVKAKTDLLQTQYVYMQLLPRRGNVVQGTWTYNPDVAATEWLTDRRLDTAGQWFNQVAAAINDEYSYPVFLPAGTYSFEIFYQTNSDRGILALRLGATVLGTVDMYSAGAVNNVVSTINFTVAADIAANLRMVIATKNAASTNYILYMQKATLWRRT